MKVKAYWKSTNPFIPNVDLLGYSKTVDVPDNTDMGQLKEFAISDSRDGYVFEKFEIIEEKQCPVQS